MAKYCVKCGKALPDGVEICPDCNAVGQSEADAALFTMLTSNAEIWRESGDDEERRRSRAEKLHRNRKKIIAGCVSGILVLAVAFTVLFFLPVSRVQRYLDHGDYDRALALYTEKLADSQPSERTKAKLLEAAESVVASLAAREINDGQAEAAMESLRSFGSFTGELFTETEAELAALYSSSENMSLAGEAFSDGNWLRACDHYLLVAENDALYADAQAKAEECLKNYAGMVLEEARGLISEGEYVAAIECMKAGDNMLGRYGTFSPELDEKLLDCYDLYEDYILTTAKGLADTEEYAAARDTVRTCVEDFGYETPALLAALEAYSGLADKQLMSVTSAQAEQFYSQGKYEESFAVLEAILDELGEEDEASLRETIAGFERRFAKDMCDRADADYGGDRDALPDVIAALEAALDIRDLDAIDDKIDELKELLPFDLIIDAYSEKSGEVNRNSTQFKALDGSSYGAWMWGRNEACIVYELDAEYDVFEALFAVRGDKGDGKSAYFELWMDGEKIYTSETLSSGSDTPVIPITVDVTGVKVLKIVFCCDYEASPTENGYSYHGICKPVVYRKSAK